MGVGHGDSQPGDAWSEGEQACVADSGGGRRDQDNALLCGGSVVKRAEADEPGRKRIDQRDSAWGELGASIIHRSRAIWAVSV